MPSDVFKSTVAAPVTASVSSRQLASCSSRAVLLTPPLLCRHQRLACMVAGRERKTCGALSERTGTNGYHEHVCQVHVFTVCGFLLTRRDKRGLMLHEVSQAKSQARGLVRAFSCAFLPATKSRHVTYHGQWDDGECLRSGKDMGSSFRWKGERSCYHHLQMRKRLDFVNKQRCW